MYLTKHVWSACHPLRGPFEEQSSATQEEWHKIIYHTLKLHNKVTSRIEEFRAIDPANMTKDDLDKMVALSYEIDCPNSSWNGLSEEHKDHYTKMKRDEAIDSLFKRGIGEFPHRPENDYTK